MSLPRRGPHRHRSPICSGSTSIAGRRRITQLAGRCTSTRSRRGPPRGHHHRQRPKLPPTAMFHVAARDCSSTAMSSSSAIDLVFGAGSAGPARSTRVTTIRPLPAAGSRPTVERPKVDGACAVGLPRRDHRPVNFDHDRRGCHIDPPRPVPPGEAARRPRIRRLRIGRSSPSSASGAVARGRRGVAPPEPGHRRRRLLRIRDVRHLQGINGSRPNATSSRAARAARHRVNRMNKSSEQRPRGARSSSWPRSSR
jgi:hypothetical protein